jgi:photosystem II stability/assembly factor-like uncharacterized protein
VAARLATLVEANQSGGAASRLEASPRRWTGQWSHRLTVVFVAAAIIVVFFVPLPHVSLFKRLVAPAKVTPTGTTVPKVPRIQFVLSEVAPVAMTFVDTAHGFVLSQGCTKSVCEAWVDATADGGERWQAQPAFVAYQAADNVKTALPESQVPNPDRLGADGLVFMSAEDGWAYGPGLFVTHDGGREFRRLNVSSPVLGVVASGGRVWVLEQRCLPANQSNDGGWPSKCDRSVLLSGPVGGDSLSPVGGQIPGFPLAPGAMDGSQFPTEIVHANSILAVLAGPYGLDVTNNGGRTWRRASYPCKGMYGGNVVSSGWGPGSVAMDPTGSIWLVCAGEPGAGQQPKQLWRSLNNAKTWLGPYPLSWSGYADTIYPVSSTVAWNYGSRAPVLRSTNGGHTWKALLESVFNDAEGGPAAFSAIGTQDAWAIPSDQVPTEVLRTTNGGRSWQSVKASTVPMSLPAVDLSATPNEFALRILDEARVPAHARVTIKDVSGSLGRVFETPGVVGLIDLHRFYIVDELPGAAEGYVEAHLPKGAQVTTSTSFGAAPTGGAQGYAVSLPVSGPHEYLAELAYYFAPVGTASETEIRVDSQTVWEPSRSTGELAPPGGIVEVTGFTKVSLFGSSGPTTVRLSTAQARKLRATLNALPLGPPATCMEDALLYRIVFRPTKGSAALFEADGWACSAVVLVTEHGRNVAPLYDATCSLLHAVIAVLPARKAEGTRHATVGCRTS